MANVQPFDTGQPDLVSALIRGNELASQTRNAPVLDRILKNQARSGEIANTQGEQDIAQTEQDKVERGILIMGRLSESLLKIPEEERQEFVQRVSDSPEAARIGLGPEVLSQLDISREKLEFLAEQGQMLGADAAIPAEQQAFEALIADFPLEQQTEARQVKAGLKARAINDPIVDIGGVKYVFDRSINKYVPTEIAGKDEVVDADFVAKNEEIIAKGKAAGTGAGTGLSGRRNKNMQVGLDAAIGIPVVRRALELLDLVKTGGIDQANLRAKQFFGIEGANEAELSANLGTAVLSKLKPTFGSQFTESEGARLERIEAGFGKSTAGNRRLLAQTLRIAEQAANLGIKDAVAAKDYQAAANIQAAIDFDLTPPEPTPTGETATNPETGQQVQEMSDGSWVPVSG